MKNSYVIEYLNENEFRKKERAVKKYNMLAYKKLIFEFYPNFRDGIFDGVVVSKNAGEGIVKYELKLPTDSTFAKVYDDIGLHYTVYEQQKIVMLNNITPDDILMEEDTKNFFINNGDDIIVQKNYFELYVPDSYFNNNERCEDLGNMINLFGVTNVGIFDEIGKFQGFGTLNLPSWNKYYVYDTESRAIELPGLGMTNCTVYKYMKGHKFCISNLLEDSANAQLFLRHITYGKLPGSIPYDKALFLWRKNQKLNKVNFGVPSFTEEVVLSSSYRYKKDPTMKFAKIAGRKGSNVSMYDYEMASIRRISQLTSTFTGITFESFDDMVTTSINRSRDHRNETESPLEELFKL